MTLADSLPLRSKRSYAAGFTSFVIDYSPRLRVFASPSSPSSPSSPPTPYLRK
ncbi:MAG: hypothetical protein KME21_06660 [Desmonostoc vinosum HA7617-LM4]|nr:hypothetical protein [Desmonostoc vinosum HA7617-LM4]